MTFEDKNDNKKLISDNRKGDDEIIFFEENASGEENKLETEFETSSDIELAGKREWKILVVDDEEDVHTVTHLTLDDFIFEGKPVKILDAYSADEAFELIKSRSDIAIALLDVVMETTTAGLELVHRIRDELDNHFIRIILRTGQPGYAPEREVVINYDINDYKSKTELTSEKIFTLVTSGLRAYKSLLSLESYRRDLQKKVEDAVEAIRQKDHIIIRQSRQSAISELIANVSHQWRQPLNSVMALIQDIEYTSEENKIDLEYIQKQSNRAMAIIEEMSETIDDLRYFFEPMEEQEAFLLDDVLFRCKKLLEATLTEEGIKLEITGETGIKIKGYRNDYAQVILQMINNSREALIESGKIEKWISIDKTQKAGNSLVKIRDNGGGIPENVIEHIFEPYFTTRFKSPGKGLSLYMCQIVIEKNMAGKIIAGNWQEGAEFSIEV